MNESASALEFIKIMRKNFGVIGLGKFGSNIALTLEKLGRQVFAVDKDESLLEKVKDYVSSARVVDSTDKDALRESGITSCDTVIVAIGSNVEASFLTVLNLKELEVSNIIAKAHTPEQGRILEKIGAIKVVYPEKENAIRLANQLTSSDILEYLEVSPDYQVTEVKSPEEFVGKKLEELHLRRNYRILVLAIRHGEKIVIIPDSEEVIQSEDILVMVAQTEDMLKFIKAHNLDNKH